jgi:hypothetical protein
MGQGLRNENPLFWSYYFLRNLSAFLWSDKHLFWLVDNVLFWFLISVFHMLWLSSAVHSINATLFSFVFFVMCELSVALEDAYTLKLVGGELVVHKCERIKSKW